MAQRNGTTNGLNGHISTAAPAPSAGTQPTTAPMAPTTTAMPRTNGTTTAPSGPSTNGAHASGAATNGSISTSPVSPMATSAAGSTPSSPPPARNDPPPPPVNSPATPAVRPSDDIESIATRLQSSTLLTPPPPPPAGNTPANRDEAMRALAVAWQRLDFAGLQTTADAVNAVGALTFGEAWGRALAEAIANA